MLWRFPVVALCKGLFACSGSAGPARTLPVIRVIFDQKFLIESCGFSPIHLWSLPRAWHNHTTLSDPWGGVEYDQAVRCGRLKVQSKLCFTLSYRIETVKDEAHGPVIESTRSYRISPALQHASEDYGESNRLISIPLTVLLSQTHNAPLPGPSTRTKSEFGTTLRSNRIIKSCEQFERRTWISHWI